MRRLTFIVLIMSRSAFTDFGTSCIEHDSRFVLELAGAAAPLLAALCCRPACAAGCCTRGAVMFAVSGTALPTLRALVAAAAAALLFRTAIGVTRSVRRSERMGRDCC